MSDKTEAFAHSLTRENLMRAFAGESQARNRYTIAAGIAHKAGLAVVEGIFLFTAEQEKSHAKQFYRQLHDMDINLFITGVTNETIDWVRPTHEEARRWGVSILGGTHCSTEMFAPRSLAPFFKELGLDTQYIPDEPNMEDL